MNFIQIWHFRIFGSLPSSKAHDIKIVNTLLYWRFQNIFSRTKWPYSAKPCTQHSCASGRIAKGFWSVSLLQKAPSISSFSKTGHFVVMRLVSINISLPINERLNIVLIAIVKIVHPVMSKLPRYVSWLSWVAMRIRNLWRCSSPKRKKKMSNMAHGPLVIKSKLNETCHIIVIVNFIDAREIFLVWDLSK